MFADADDLGRWSSHAEEVGSLDETGPALCPGSAEEDRRDRQEEVVDEASLQQLSDDGRPALTENALVAAGAQLGDDVG